jgi:hypothetical protein
MDPGGNSWLGDAVRAVGNAVDNFFGGDNRAIDANLNGRNDWADYQLAAYEAGGSLTFEEFESRPGNGNVDLRGGLTAFSDWGPDTLAFGRHNEDGSYTGYCVICEAATAVFGGGLIKKGASILQKRTVKRVAEWRISRAVLDPRRLFGKSANEIKEIFEKAGFEVRVKEGKRGSGRALFLHIDRGPINRIEVHPGGGTQHGAPYVKISGNLPGGFGKIVATTRAYDPKRERGAKYFYVN